MNNINNGNTHNEFINILSEGFTSEDLLVLKKLDSSCLGKCDPKSFFKKVQMLKLNIKIKNKGAHPFLHNFEKIENGDNLVSKPNCDFVFSLFLFHSCKIISSKFYNVLAIFFSHLRECLNLYGYSLIQEIKEKNVKIFCFDIMNNIEIDHKKEDYTENELNEETRRVFREKLSKGELDERKIEIDLHLRRLRKIGTSGKFGSKEIKNRCRQTAPKITSHRIKRGGGFCPRNYARGRSICSTIGRFR